MSNLTMSVVRNTDMAQQGKTVSAIQRDPDESANSNPSANSEDRNFARKACRVAIVDSRQCLREALADAFMQKYGVQVSVHESLAALTESRLKPEEIRSVILQLTIGISRPEFEEHVSSLRRWAPEAKIVLLADTLTREVADLCALLKIQGLVSSEYSSDQILVCVNVVESGLNYMPANIEYKSMHSDLTNDDVAGVKLPNLDGTLTRRQQQVMRYIALGKSNKYIAAELSLCESTVKVHVSEVMRRLNATSRTHACYIMNQMEHENQVLA